MASERIVLVYILGLMCWTHGEKVNIALGKRASTSLGHLRGWTPGNIVDGDRSTTLPSPDAGRTCFHGASSPSDWSVDLGREYQLYNIRVYIWVWMSTSWKTRTAGSIIYLDNIPSRVCYTFPAAAFIVNNPTDVTCNDTGRYVTLRNPGTGGGHNHALNLCEVEIYVCSNGTYGIHCTDFCHCASPPCDRWTGVCSGDCAAGYRGKKCDTICSNTTYGVNCKEKCVYRKCNTKTASCDHVTGSCDTGCLPGWMGTDCTGVCGTQYYGSNCSNICAERNCDGNSTCHHVTGSCDTGCKAGWKGTDCMQACDRNHYGQVCTGVCDTRHCEGSSSCNPITGQCDGGCQTGWDGTDCTECDNQYYGTNCASVCTDRQCNGNSSCDHVTGSCDKGCRHGWNGVDCRKEMLPADSPPVPAIVGGVIGAVVLVLVLVLLIVFLRRRGTVIGQRKMAKPCSNNIYENVGRAEESKQPDAAAAIGLAQLNGQTRCASEDFDSKSVDTLEEEEDYDSPAHNTQQEGGRDYYNLDNIRISHLVNVSQLVVRVREFEENTELSKEEFLQLPDSFLHPYDESQKPGNKAKNRFKGYYPYNYNRVVLNDIGDGGRSDYINASYLDGYNSKNRFIAAQGPYRDDIIEDFWRMIWQEGCKVVVMVTGLVEVGKMKCLRYWPEAGSIIYGDVKVTMETETKLADYTITKLAVQSEKASKTRHVTHFHFTTWPDHGVPDTSCLLQYMWRINSTSGQQKHPIVVHCSAGIGRTGTYIAVESLVSQATTEGTVDVVSFVSNMRSQRKNMIQTKEQYLFIYQAIMAAVVDGDTSMDADIVRQVDLGHMTDVRMGNKTVQHHLEVMANSAETGIPDDVITIPSYASRTGFFVTTSRTAKEEVWNQCYNSGSRTLVMWGHADKSYLPSSEKPISTSVLTATMRSSTGLSNHVTLSEVELMNRDQKKGIPIQIYHVTGSVRDLGISVLIGSLLQWTGQPECESTTLISNSVSETRLLILLVNITSRLQDDGKVEVISNMRRLQSLLGGPRFTVDDVRLCLEFAQHRLESLGTYANL